MTTILLILALNFFVGFLCARSVWRNAVKDRKQWRERNPHALKDLAPDLPEDGWLFMMTLFGFIAAIITITYFVGTAVAGMVKHGSEDT